MKRDDVFSSTASNYYDHLTNLFRLIDRGDASIGLPPYNGGLFSSEAAPLLDSVRLPDDIVAQIVYELSHTKTEEMGEIVRRFVNYRDMSVQQLGSIYERLLERQPARNDLGEITIQPNPYARKDSGSFYTPQELVDIMSNGPSSRWRRSDCRPLSKRRNPWQGIADQRTCVMLSCASSTPQRPSWT